MSHEPTKRILAIARSFPCLQDKLDEHELDEEGRFDADAFHNSMATWSSGERRCGLFILNVWNHGYAQRNMWNFDLVDFIATVDMANRRALIDWMNKPVWP